METKTYTIGTKKFILEKGKAEKAFEDKKIINGKDSMFFNILPIKYKWAYDLYKTMKSNHWEPEDIPMQRDIEQWQDSSGQITDVDRWIIKMGIGYFSAAEGIVGDNILHVTRELVTAPELKLILGRHAHEENIHADSLVYMISSLGINPHECEAMFEDIPSIKKKTEFVVNNSKTLRRDVDLTKLEEKQVFAKNLFVFGQCMEGTQFYGLFGMLLSLKRQNKFTGIGQMFSYTLRDESSHIKVFKELLLSLIDENPEIWTEDFKEDLRNTMKEAVQLEKDFVSDCLPLSSVGLSETEFHQYIDYIADRRLLSCNLKALNEEAINNPFPWLSEVMDLNKESNFFETRVTEYSKSSRLEQENDDDL